MIRPLTGKPPFSGCSNEASCMATPPSTTVLKAFELLDLFTERSLLGAGEAARLLGAPRASAHRLLVTLRAAGVLESNEQGQYRLGLRLFELGSYSAERRGAPADTISVQGQDRAGSVAADSTGAA